MSVKPRRGRPPDPTVETALRQAAREELAEHGWRGTTVERIAERAGVARKTIYRRYGSVHGVLLLGLDGIYAQVPVPDSGSVRDDLVAVARDIIAVWRDPVQVRYLAALHTAQYENAALARAFQQNLRQRRQATSLIITRGIARGELAPDTDADLLLDFLDGIIMERTLERPQPLAHDFPERLVDQLLAGFLPPAGA